MQHAHGEGRLKQLQQRRCFTTLEECTKDRKVNHMAPKRFNNDKAASAQAGLQESFRHVKILEA